MIESYGQEYLNFGGVARLIVSRMPWRFALKLTNPQIAPGRCRAVISERSVDMEATLDEMKWMIETGKSLCVQLDDNEHEEYGVFSAKLLFAEVTPSALDFTLEIDEESTDFKVLYESISSR